ncbi:MAG: DUF389 domain-containing protein [Bacteroidetes bacterium]|nr:DUF389 domain-containing protein [Fibrella sp.]
MQRTFSISLDNQYTDSLIAQLQPLEEVIGLSLQRDGSLKPPGDILTVQVLNTGAGEVLKRVAGTCPPTAFSITTSELASIINPAQEERVRRDIDEAIWEEMETGLRYNGRVTTNFLSLMALGGAISAVGLVSEPGPQAVAFVAASIIAPGFEPLAKVPLGLVLQNYRTVFLGLRSSLIGYTVVVLGPVFTFLLLQWLGVTNAGEFISNPEVDAVAHPTGKNLTISLCGTLAGCVIVAAYRRSVIAGALIAIVAITTTAMIGLSLACRRLDLAGQGLQRLGIDVVLIVVSGIIVFGTKQWLFRRRKPLV